MKEIEKILNSELELSNDQVVEIFKIVGDNGDIIIIKNDGIRKEKPFTVVISSSNGKFESIRYDSEALNTALTYSVRRYLEYVKNE